jgi:hypothetical protein
MDMVKKDKIRQAVNAARNVVKTSPPLSPLK